MKYMASRWNMMLFPITCFELRYPYLRFPNRSYYSFDPSVTRLWLNAVEFFLILTFQRGRPVLPYFVEVATTGRAGEYILSFATTHQFSCHWTGCVPLFRRGSRLPTSIETAILEWGPI